MRNPYAQVALTYIRRPFASMQSAIAWAFFVGITGFLVWGFVHDQRLHVSPPDGRALIPLYLMLTALLAGFLATHAKEQFADSRAHLLPGFRRVHIVAAATVTFLLAVAAPCVVTWLVGVHSVGLIAVTLLVFGGMLWSVLVLSNWLLWPILALVLFSIPDARETLALLVTPRYEVLAVALLAVGVAAVVSAGARLFRLCEEMPEYHRRMPTGWAAKGRLTGQNVNYDIPMPRTLVDWFREHAMANATRHARYAAHSLWSRICRWRVGTPTGWRVWLWGLFPLGYFQLLGWLLPRPIPGTIQANMAASMMLANSFGFLPMVLIMPQLAGWLLMRNRTMAYEVMLPVTRRAYVRQMIGALAASYFEFCGVILASTVLWCLVGITPCPLQYVGSLAAAALLTQICQFGVMVFAHTITRLRLLQFVALAVPMIGSMLLITGGARTNNFQLLPAVLPIAAGSAVLGALLAYIAYRRWLVADID
jgi:hypothetical protein